MFAAGCTVGPKYRTPAAATPAPTYKELPPGGPSAQTGLWKPAQPSDTVIRAKWWEMYNDPQLNELEEKVNASNQTIAASFSSFMAARALVREARSAYFPTVGTSPSISELRELPLSASTTSNTTGSRFSEYILPFDASWVPDLWGRIRNTVKSNIYSAQASAADLENVRLTEEADLAFDYNELRGQDSLKQLLDSTVVAYQQSLELTQALYETGIDSDESVAQAETQLETAEASDTGVGITRAQYEHAIATLVGQPASEFSIPVRPLNATPPSIPVGIPSQLLERRPDIAASERLVAQANAQIGIATAAFYPNLTLAASGGFQNTSITDWLTWPSRVWSVGPTLAETIFEGGLRRATVQQFQANYDVTVADYRQTVLTAFQQVEDNLASLRILSQEIEQQDTAVRSAERNLSLATDRYRLGIDPYLNVLTAQTTLLNDQLTAVNLRISIMTASVQLIEALGGGWNSSQLPAPNAIIANAPPQTTTTPTP